MQVHPHIHYTVNGGIQTLDEVLEISADAPGNFLGCMIGRAVVNNVCMLAEADTKIYNTNSDPPTAHSRLTLLEAYRDYLHDRYDDENLVNGNRMAPTQSCFTALRPVLPIFHGMHGNRKWRQHVDGLSKERGLTPAQALEKIITTWENRESLELPIVKDY